MSAFLRTFVAVAAAGLVFAAEAAACVCAQEPMSKRLNDADAAVVGHVVAERRTALRGAPQLLLTVDVEQRVKGRGLSDTLEVRSPLQTDCDVDVPRGRSVGWLLTKSPDGELLATACSIVNATDLVAAGGEPRGGAIKVAVGVVILGLVVLWALRRLRRGARPQLPGLPRP